MSFKASNGEPLAPVPRLALSNIWVDINHKKLQRSFFLGKRGDSQLTA